ncbi:LPS-assembly protein LptD [Chachezhania antarctica]|uniref:LPS-assembly protein LptD n=1 Tax=Chachezhania antarctica TaxID=2340860 RepID=UPI000EAB8AD9|nr:LPS assembly protein LptD [Chachezhania antarctica]
MTPPATAPAHPLALRLLATFVLTVWAVLAHAQDAPMGAGPAILVADRIYLVNSDTLVAEGNVEAFHDSTRLRAGKISYDRTTERLSIEGPIRIDRGEGTLVLADRAELDSDLETGLLVGARLVLNQQLQMASQQMKRVGGRYTQLYKSAVTACRVCETGRAPLWQIRARKVIHDQQERQIYFENATFRILDVPVFYFPRLRLPDPSVKRARGFLIPELRSTTELGVGLRLPYFIPLGDSADVTLYPYLSPQTRTLGARYRQALERGELFFEGALSKDDIIPGKLRGYLFGYGQFFLDRDWSVDFDIKTVSDNAYLLNYGLPDYDRLRSEVGLQRIQRDNMFRAELNYFKSLRDNELETQQPTFVTDAFYVQRFVPAQIGGEFRFMADIHSHGRASREDMVGRDVARTTLDMVWKKDWILRGGYRSTLDIGASTDNFGITDDSAFPQHVSRTTPRMALGVSRPMTRTTQTGAVQYLEPIVQLGWANLFGGNVPNEESRFVEFDRGNLISLSRFPAPDRREHAPTFVYGATAAHYAPSGLELWGAAGQVLREPEDADFTPTSGLEGTVSDLLLAGEAVINNRLWLNGRTLLNTDLSVSKAELRGRWTSSRTALVGSYLWLGADPEEERLDTTSEIWFDGSYAVRPGWTANANMRYDVTEDTPTSLGVGLIYSNECVELDLSLSRRYTTTASVDPSTSFGINVRLGGFAVQNSNYRRTCS